MSFWIILIGALVACACSIVGCFLVLRKMSMVGDAISHSVLPGIVIVFLLSGSRDTIFMLTGAIVFGLLTVYLISLFRNSWVQDDAAIGVVFTALFAVGVVLVSLYTRQVHIDLDHVLYGEIAYAPWNVVTIGGGDLGPQAVWLVGAVLLVNIIIISLFYKQFKLCSFDPVMAAALGVSVIFFHYLLMTLVSVTTVVSFDSVGAILVVGMLIVPAATAYLLTEQLSKMILISCLIGVACSFFGYYGAVLLDASIAGCMIAVAGILFVMALFFSPSHGVVSKVLRRRKLAQEM
ncbi:metal ABC transporter permease [Bacillus sp. AGMB 02131]|uniref:Metal ABC transporter permease n=2 Tax=Peribacillus faecalis TaxID=2772559 RepID=A0A927D0D5_9BACI|nr:metal ABC transporter permease [Peribacillus faecalis]